MTTRTGRFGHARRIALSALCCSLVFGPRSARAQELTDPLALSLKGQGDAALVDGRFSDALEAYTRASALENSPVLAYNRGRALQALERNAEALEALETFQRTASQELLLRVPKLEGLLAQVRSRVSSLRITCNVPGATAHLGARFLSMSELTRGMRVDAGPATLVIESDDYLPYKKPLELVPAREQVVHVALVRRDDSALLRVSTPVPAARIFVDGELLGQAPTELRLAPSAHVVRVERAGYESAIRRVVLNAREIRSISVPLVSHAPLTSRWWFWAGVATTVVAGTAVAVALSTERSPSSGDIAPGTVAAPLIRFH